jgi:hypothetical protein
MGLFGSLLNRTPSVPCALADNHPVLKQIDTLFGTPVVKSADWSPKLVPGINAAVEFFDREVGKIPGPFDITAARYMHDAFEHALFESRYDIAHGIGRSKDIKVQLAFIAAGGQAEAFALMGVRRRVTDDAEAKLPIGDHTMRSLTLSEASTRRTIRDAALAALVSAFEERVEKLRRGARLTQRDWLPFATEGDLDAAVDGDAATHGQGMLDALLGWLAHADLYLKVDPAQALQIPDVGADGTAISLPQMRTRDRRKWAVCIARLSIAEAVAAMQHETNQHRAILI